MTAGIPPGAADGARCLLDVLLAGERWVPEDWPAEILDRAWELGTTAVVRRHQELRRIVDDLPELTYTEPEDLERFRVLRAQNDGWRATLRPRIRRFLANRPRAEGPAVQAFTVCAWCDLVRVDPERWLPLLSSYDTVGAGLASHGICPACEEGLVQTPG